MSFTLTGGEELGKQMEFLLGCKLTKEQRIQIGHEAHLTKGNEWVMKALIYLGKKVSDIKFAEDREVLKDEFFKNKKYKSLFTEMKREMGV